MGRVPTFSPESHGKSSIRRALVLLRLTRQIEKKAPDEVILPPRFPDAHLSVAEILQQYEDYFEVDGICYSPIRLWGDEKRPKTISAARFSTRLQQYCGAKIKGSAEPKMNQNAMKKAGNEWANEIVGSGKKKVWKDLAEKAYDTGRDNSRST